MSIGQHLSIFSLKRFAFQTLRPVVARKKAGRRCVAASHVAFFQRQHALSFDFFFYVEKMEIT